MGLRDQALLDSGRIIESVVGFGQAVTLTNPAGVQTALTGLTGEIARLIDPDTGVPVSGRTVHVTLHMPSLPAGGRPQGVNDTSQKPWTVTMPNLVTGGNVTFAIVATDPDESIGQITVELSAYRA